MSLESQYLATKLVKGFLRTKYMESNSRLCMASAGTGYKQSLGADGPPGSYTDFDTTNLFFVIGSSTSSSATPPARWVRIRFRPASTTAPHRWNGCTHTATSWL